LLSNGVISFFVLIVSVFFDLIVFFVDSIDVVGHLLTLLLEKLVPYEVVTPRKFSSSSISDLASFSSFPGTVWTLTYLVAHQSITGWVASSSGIHT